MLNNEYEIEKFKKVRAKYKKKAISGTVVKDRLEAINLALRGKFYGFKYLNETEKMDFLLIAMEMLMVASGTFEGFKSVEAIAKEIGDKAYFEKYGKMPEELEIDHEALRLEILKQKQDRAS